MSDAGNKLFDEVLTDARTKADRARKRGQREAEAAARKIEEQVQADVEQILGEGRKQAEARRREILATVEIEAQRERLARLEEKLQAVYQAALEQLRGSSAQELEACVATLAGQAVVMAPDGEYELALPAALHEGQAGKLAEALQRQVGQEAKRQMTLRTAARAAEGNGPTLRSIDGRVMIDQSLEERLRRLWPELRLQAGKRLFGR